MVYKKRHELSISKVNSCLNKQELDSASYFHNSIKTLKTEVQNFTLPKTSIASSEEKKCSSKGCLFISNSYTAFSVKENFRIKFFR